MKLKTVFALAFFGFFNTMVLSQQVISLPVTGKPGKAMPGIEVTVTPENGSGRIVYNVTEPSISIYKPAKENSNGIGILVCPGGAFHILAYDDEGVTIAKSLVEKGYTVAVLKYRLVHLDPKDPFGKLNESAKNFELLESVMAPVVPLAIADGKSAMQYLKAHADALGITPDKVGVIGFSAGGTLAAAIALDASDTVKPLFSAPIYPYLAPVLKTPVPPAAPPLFIAVTEDDDFGFDGNSLKFYEQWKAAEGAAELHVYTKGRHGFASKQQGLPVDHWMEVLLGWLDTMGYGVAQR